MPQFNYLSETLGNFWYILGFSDGSTLERSQRKECFYDKKARHTTTRLQLRRQGGTKDSHSGKINH